MWLPIQIMLAYWTHPYYGLLVVASRGWRPIPELVGGNQLVYHNSQLNINTFKKESYTIL